MKRILAYLLPLAVLASCGTMAQYAQQRYQDGIYGRVEPAEESHIYSKEDFEQMAALNIARERLARDTVYIPVYEKDASSDFLFGFGAGLALSDWYSPWYRNWWWNDWGWRYGWNWRFYDPWHYGWGYDYWHWRSWGYGPWYWYDPWYYDPWHYDPWYGPSFGYRHDHWAPKPGLSSDGRRYYGERRYTQDGGTQSGRPGRSNYRPGVSGGSYGSAGSTSLNNSRLVPRGSQSGSSVSRPSSSQNRGGSRVTPGQNGYNYSRGYQGRSTKQSGSSGTGSYSRSGSNSTRSSGSSSSSNSSSWGGSSRSSGSSYSGGSSSRSYGGGGGSSSHSGGGGGSSRGGGRR